jgi:myo-inositol-1(or 4)-monophosphatase
MNQISSQQLLTLLDIATEAALSAGSILQKYWGKLDNIEEKSHPGDLVTEADKQAEAEIIQILQRHFPDHPILAEESGQVGDKNNTYLWAIDPLDGTTNYAHNYPVFAVSIGLMIDGIPSLGVVYSPFRKELFRGAKGLGATCNRRSIRVSQTSQLSKSLLATGFAYDRRETKDNNYAEFCHLTHLTQGVRRSGAASIDLIDVACGRLDGYWERGLKPWDVVAGMVILEEAGGKISAYDQNLVDINSGRILATNSRIHSSLSQVLCQTIPLNAEFL